MKVAFVFLSLLLINGCSGEQMEELAFRKTLEFHLVDLCEEDDDCINAIEKQIASCMVKSNWRKYLNDDKEMDNFIKKFYPCFKDTEGDSYFSLDV